MTELYLLSITEAAKLPSGFAETFFPERAARAQKFLHREDLLRSHAAGTLEACVLGVREEDIAFGPQGKPYLKNGGPKFSLSHSGDYALLAISDTEIGADIEALLPVRQRERIAERMFTEEERRYMAEAPGTRFYTIWTMKESFMKLDGRGFSIAPSGFTVLPLLSGGTIESAFGPVYGKTEILSGLALSVCALQPVAGTPVKTLTIEELPDKKV